MVSIGFHRQRIGWHHADRDAIDARGSGRDMRYRLVAVKV